MPSALVSIIYNLPSPQAGDAGNYGPTSVSAPPSGSSNVSLPNNGTANISAMTCVTLLNGVLVTASSQNPAGFVLGVAANSAQPGQSVEIVTQGEVTLQTWNWALTAAVYLGPSGNLVQTAPTTGFAQQIGVPLTPTSLLVQIYPPVLLD